MFNRAISFSKLKILYARITLTPFTTLYFFLAVFTCLALSALQVVTFFNNSKAASVLKPIGDFPNFGIPILDKGRLELCQSLPSEGTIPCVQVINFKTSFVNRTLVLQNISSVTASPISNLSSTCIVSLRWLDELLQDNEREDMVTLLFNIYLFTLAVITVVNESIPHLFAALFGHVMSAAWTVYRVLSTVTLMNRYKSTIIPLACDGVDLFRGSSWAASVQQSIPLLVVHVLTLVVFSYLSFILFKGYNIQTFSRVGAAPRIHKMYKIVLVFLVCLQLANFFCLASNVLWLTKAGGATMSELSIYVRFYRIAFIVYIVIHLPWFVMGWISVRKESRVQFAVCITIAVILFGISTALFFSPMYRYIFLTWPFFTTVTCTAYVLLVATTVFSIICRLNFGKGLAEYLHVTHVLEGIDFTPVCFSKTEEGMKKNLYTNIDDEKGSVRFANLPSPAHQDSKAARGSWIFSAQNGFTVQMSTTPPLLSEIGPVPSRLANKVVIGLGKPKSSEK